MTGRTSPRNHIRELEAGVPPTPVEVAEYVADLLPTLAKMARAGAMPVLAHLLEIAQAEAKRLAKSQPANERPGLVYKH